LTGADGGRSVAGSKGSAAMRQTTAASRAAALAALGVALGLAYAAALAPPAAAAEPPARQPLTLTNASGRLVYCAVLVEARLYTNVRLKPGARWTRDFDPRREVSLVCNRATKPVYGPLPLGAYSFGVKEGRVALERVGTALLG
jgi:hypothetical protein